jgi:hypothetical protein
VDDPMSALMGHSIARRWLASMACLVIALGTATAAAPRASAVTAVQLAVPFFSQRDSQWSGDALGQTGSCSSTIGAQGCLLTSVAMVYSFYNVKVVSTTYGTTGMNPRILNSWLKAKGGFSGCLLIQSKTPEEMNYNGQVSYNATSVRAELDAGRPVIAGVATSPTGGTVHYMVITGQNSAGAFTFNDPWDTSSQTRTMPNGALGTYYITAVFYYSKQPFVYVDDLDSGFAPSGPSNYWHPQTVGWRSHMIWTYINTTRLDNSGTWTPNLPSAGSWQVYVLVPSNYATTGSAKYTIYYNGGNTTRSVNQNAYYDDWVSIGTYTFAAGTGGRVYLPDTTGESGMQMIGFDAVKWVKR